MNIKEHILYLLRRIFGTHLLIPKVEKTYARTNDIVRTTENIIERVNTIANRLDELALRQHFNDAYVLYGLLQQDNNVEEGFNKDRFDSLLLLATYFSESTKRYARLTSGRGLFHDKWIVRDSDGQEYLNIRGVRLTSKIPNLTYSGVSIFHLIFQRSLFVHAFFGDNYDHSIVELLDKKMGEGARGYKRDDFDVTVKPGDIVIDAGAWIGDFSAYAAYKGATVYAFEPTPTTYDLLCDTAILNDGKIYPVLKALSDFNGEVRFCANKFGAGNKILSGQETRSAETIVNSTTLDAFVEENGIRQIDFIKADIQGGERDMLKGAVKVLQKFAPRLVIATDHLPDDPIVLEEIIREANPKYKIVQLRTVLFAAVVEK